MVTYFKSINTLENSNSIYTLSDFGINVVLHFNSVYILHD